MLCDVLDQHTTRQPKCNGGKQMTMYDNLKMIIGKIKYNTLKYGITITIDPCYPYKNRRFKSMSDDRKHTVVKMIIEKYVSKNNLNMQYIIIPEYSNKSGHLHYHGIVWNCYQKTFSNFVRKLRGYVGFCKPEMKINHYDEWIKYIFKDYGKSGLSTIINIYDD